MKNKPTIKYQAEGTEGGSVAVDETVAITDPITEEVFQVPKKFQTLIGHISSVNRNAKNKKYEELMEDYNKELEELRTENTSLKKQATEGNGEIDKRIENVNSEWEKKYNKVIEEKEEITVNLNTIQERHKNTIVDNALLSAIGKHEITNKSDFLALIKAKGNIELKDKFDITTGEPTGEQQVLMSLALPDDSGNIKQVELDASEAIDKYLELDDNKMWLRSQLKSGGGGKNSVETSENGNAIKTTAIAGSIADALKSAPVVAERR